MGGMGLVIYGFLGFVVFGFHIGLSIAIADAAHSKGYSGAGYFWLCFLFPPFGQLLVASLPDLSMQNTIKQLQMDIHIIKDELKKAQMPVPRSVKRNENYDDNDSLPTL